MMACVRRFRGVYRVCLIMEVVFFYFLGCWGRVGVSTRGEIWLDWGFSLVFLVIV